MIELTSVAHLLGSSPHNQVKNATNNLYGTLIVITHLGAYHFGITITPGWWPPSAEIQFQRRYLFMIGRVADQSGITTQLGVRCGNQINRYQRIMGYLSVGLKKMSLNHWRCFTISRSSSSRPNGAINCRPGTRRSLRCVAMGMEIAGTRATLAKTVSKSCCRSFGMILSSWNSGTCREIWDHLSVDQMSFISELLTIRVSISCGG